MSIEFRPERGGTLWIPGTGPPSDPDKAHLYVILTATCSNGQNLLVPICRARKKFDPTCVIEPSENAHDFIIETSYVAYAFLQTYGAPFLINQVKKKIMADRGPIASVVLTKICDGIDVSDLSPPRQQQYYAEQAALRNP